MVSIGILIETGVRLIDVPLTARDGHSVLAYSADRDVLGGFLSPDDRWRFPASENDVDAAYVRMLLAYEDRNFWHHAGVDGIAIIRALWQAALHGRSVSGASTITMQLVRVLDPKPRDFKHKFIQILQALKLERAMSKEQILEAYLTVSPFGANIEGVRAASLIYFGKEPTALSLEEKALLIALPQAPESRRPDRSIQAALTGRNQVLRRLVKLGVIGAGAATRAASTSVAVRGSGFFQRAPHLLHRLYRRPGQDPDGAIQTLLDRQLQEKLESLTAQAITMWDLGVNIATIVIRNSDGAVVGYVGSAALESKERQGFVDNVRSTRSPGSALKPFIFAMAFERLLVHPDTIVADQEIDLAGYRPENADGRFDGDISVRQALVLSKNTVPVMLLNEIGVRDFLSRFRSVGTPLRLPTSEGGAGLAVALGGVGISLEELTWFFSALANEGELRRLRYTATDRPVSLGQLFSPPAANAVADILADAPPPIGHARLQAVNGSRRVAYKTGTSYGFRDAWAVGFDRTHTVGVWIGRPDGAPHLGAYGATAAAPILFEIFQQMPAPPFGVVSSKLSSGALRSPRELPNRLKRFGPPPATDTRQPLTIAFPKNGSLISAPRASDRGALIPLRISGGRPPYRWHILGVETPPERRREHVAHIDGNGVIDIKVVDAEGNTDKISFWLEPNDH